MREINYSLICEDVAHTIFIEEFVKYISSRIPEVQFFLNSECYDPFKFNNKSNVLNFYVAASTRWFSKYNLDLLFVIADFDGWEQTHFSKYHDDLLAKLNPNVRSKTLILLPVQTIEYWLFHIKWKAENPSSTKNVSIENNQRSELKKQVYGSKKPSKELSQKSIQDIMSHFDPAWLNSRSQSFKHFYNRFSNFVKN